MKAPPPIPSPRPSHDPDAAAHPGVILVDLYNSALRDGTALAAAYDSGDGLHPNAAGSALIASLVTAGRP